MNESLPLCRVYKQYTIDYLNESIRKMMKSFLNILLLISGMGFAQDTRLLTHDNTPMGSLEQPLLLRTFMPKADLKDDVLTNHHLGRNSPKYNPNSGKDVQGEYKPIKGLPAAIGVNYGTQLSYCWDTVECRLLYAWSGGFLNMMNYWGDPKRGNRQSFGYVPELVGNLFYLAEGQHPIGVNGASLKSPKYIGFSKTNGEYIFKFKTDKDEEIHTTVLPSEKPNSFHKRIKLIGAGVLNYTPENKETTMVKQVSDQEIIVTISQATLKPYELVTEKALTAEDVNAASGEIIFNKMGCIACHSNDGSKGHGPTLLGVLGSQRPITGLKEKLVADDAYLRDSIINPNKHVLEGYPPNYMPVFKLPKHELDALILYIKTFKN